MSTLSGDYSWGISMMRTPRMVVFTLIFLGCFLSLGVTAQAAVVQDISYTYSNAGMINGIGDHKNSYNWTYQYDDVYRLTGARRGSGTTLGGGTEIYNKAYVYNNIGNITSFEGAAYTYADASHKHAVTAAGANSYTYDANGNMFSGAGRAYTWNSENKPAAITKDGVETSFVYGSEGERVKKETGEDWKIYVGGIYEKDQSGAQTCYIDAAGVSVKKKSDGQLFFILKDHLGGTSVITDGEGNVVTQQFYEPYGKDDTIGSVENEVEDHKFTGQEEDSETGLYYYENRYYDPALGRFVSPDPLFGLNKYMYCSNNPVNAVDPSGYKTIAELYPSLPENNMPIEVSVVDNTITINAYVKFSGDTNFKINSKDTFAQLVEHTIEEYWTTTFKGSEYNLQGIDGKIKTNVITRWNDDEQKYFEINLDAHGDEIAAHNHIGGGWSLDSPGTVNIKTAGAISEDNNLNYLEQCIAHEFGHALGLHEAYWLNYMGAYVPNEEIGHSDIMWFGTNQKQIVTGNDIEMMLKAYETNQMQYFVDCPDLGMTISSVINLPPKFIGGPSCDSLYREIQNPQLYAGGPWGFGEDDRMYWMPDIDPLLNWGFTP